MGTSKLQSAGTSPSVVEPDFSIEVRLKVLLPYTIAAHLVNITCHHSCFQCILQHLQPWRCSRQGFCSAEGFSKWAPKQRLSKYMHECHSENKIKGLSKHARECVHALANNVRKLSSRASCFQWLSCRYLSICHAGQ